MPCLSFANQWNGYKANTVSDIATNNPKIDAVSQKTGAVGITRRIAIIILITFFIFKKIIL